MQISSNYSNIAEIVSRINNPNLALGTLIEEIPTDIGRSVAGYKRGGILEGAEKFRKELMTAAVWMFGIPFFNKLGNGFCEKVLKIPTAIDYSNSKDGRDCISDSVNYLITGNNPKNLDVSELSKYKDKFKGMDVNSLYKRVRGAKQVTSFAAVVLNCVLMGIVIPKINQAMTARKMENERLKQANNEKQINISLDDFKNQTKKKDISFTGDFLDFVTYNTENNNTFRLCSTDAPMIIGRMATSRNKYEALEYLVMDGGSVFFYNFCSPLIQKLLRKQTNTPNINPKAAEIIGRIPVEDLKSIINGNIEGKNLKEIFGEEIASSIYKESTYGKYGKINKFIKDKDLKEIDDNARALLDYIKNYAKDKALNENTIKEAIKKANKQNGKYLALGLLVSIAGLALFIPKLTFAITKKLTGKDQFTGIANYDDKKNG